MRSRCTSTGCHHSGSTVVSQGLSLTDAGRANGRAIANPRARALRQAAALRPLLEAMRAAGRLSPAELAAALNARGIAGPCGGRWSAVAIARVLGDVGPRGR